MAGGEPWRRLCHWGPWLVLSALVPCGIVTLCATLLWAWPVRRGGSGGGVHLALLLMWVPALLSPYLHAVFAGPGFVPAGWRPQERSEEVRLLPHCEICRSYKPLRAHHCRQCRRCVLKMDHHCPWINACVGLRNHASFVAFLLLTPIASLHSLAILGCTLYQEFVGPVFFAPAASGANSTLAAEAAARCPFGMLALIGTLVSFAVALTAMPFLLLLGVQQLNGLLKNRTFIERKIEAKAAERFAGGRRERPFRFPFDLGSPWKNLQQELPPTRLRVDGLRWPTAAGADPYCVNEEHAAQKEEMKRSCVRYRVLEAYAGAACPVTEGPVVCLAAPFTGEPRLALASGDTVVVSKTMPHWMYGEKMSHAENGEDLAGRRGWFPERYVDLLDSVRSATQGDAGETEPLDSPGGNAGASLIGFAHSFQGFRKTNRCWLLFWCNKRMIVCKKQSRTPSPTQGSPQLAVVFHGLPMAEPDSNCDISV